MRASNIFEGPIPAPLLQAPVHRGVLHSERLLSILHLLGRLVLDQLPHEGVLLLSCDGHLAERTFIRIEVKVLEVLLNKARAHLVSILVALVFFDKFALDDCQLILIPLKVDCVSLLECPHALMTGNSGLWVKALLAGVFFQSLVAFGMRQICNGAPVFFLIFSDVVVEVWVLERKLFKGGLGYSLLVDREF